jgi:hypothetical protein
MEYPLSITSVIGTDRQGHQLESTATNVMASAELGPYTFFGHPDCFGGNLVAITERQLNSLKFDSTVKVGFRGKRYKFVRLEKDATFELRKDW